MTTGRSVDWSADEGEFNRFVEALIQRVWSDCEGCRTYVLDGRGGDDGIDVAVERDGVVFHIYQLKFFPEGISGGWVTRRAQVRRSFLRVADRPGLEEWTLVTPRNPTNSELRSTRGLKADRALTINVWGRSDLDQATARHSDLLANFTRRPVVEAVRDMSLESAALATAQDLPERLGKLMNMADSRSLYWGTTFAAEAGVVTVGLVPKRPDAAEMEPLSISFTPSFGPTNETLRQRYERLLAFGGMDTVELPAEVVGTVRMDGPEWFAHESSDARLSVGPELLAEDLQAELRIVDGNSAVLASLSGVLEAVTRGDRGFTLRVRSQQLELTVQHDLRAGDTTLAIGWKLAGLSAIRARTVLRMHQHLHAGRAVEIWIDGNRTLSLTSAEANDGGLVIPRDAIDFVDDLVVLSHEFDVEFLVPEEMTEADRIDVRVARHLVEGLASYSPRFGAFTTTLNDENPINDEALRPFNEAVAVLVRFDDASLDILGRRLPVGSLWAYHPSATVRDAAEHLEAIRLGQGYGRKVVLEPTDQMPIRLWLPGRSLDPDTPVTITPWGIEGIPEPLRIETI